MAERRMFAKSIVLSDAFLDMPASSRCLYFTLAMLADDEGFVNSPKSIMRQSGSSQDDMNLLLAKKFVLPVGEGVCVIKHWWIHNYIQKDRFSPTKYADLKELLHLDENKAYSLVYPECIQSVSEMDTQDSIGKVSIGKDSIGKSNSADLVPFEDFWNLWPTGHKVAKEDAIKAWKKLRVDDELFSKMAAALSWQKQSKSWTESGGKYIPHPATWLNGHRWEDERPAEATGGSWMDVAEEMQRDFMEGNQ